MLAMCEDMHPSVRVLGGNFVAALRVFAKERPWLYELSSGVRNLSDSDGLLCPHDSDIQPNADIHGRREDSESGEYRTMPLSDHAPYIHGGMTLAEFAACIGITLPHANTDDVSEQEYECAD